MKSRHALVLMLIVSCATVPLWARGTQEKDFQEAEGKDNFSQSIDLTKLNPGQYNVLVRTTDSAGNVSFAGPYNFFYDPSSDNPLITIANPAPGMRLGSSLNVVGVASAPKGMASVEVQVDGGDWVPAQGKAFWSFPFQTEALPDGPHKLTVRGTDVNGIVGPSTTVAFHLDQKAPVLTLTSHKSGDRVSGTINLGGTLTDGNGLRSLTLSVDDRKTMMPVSLQGDERALNRAFSTSLDTTRFPDGPLVLWFDGTDGQGSTVRQASLLFVDNTVPLITVLSPPPQQGLHGRVRFALQVEKSLGIRSLTARVGEQGVPVTVEVVPGNPFFVVDVDLPIKGVGTVPVLFEAVDTAGKVGKTTYLAQLNGDADLPELVLAGEWDKSTVRDPWRLAGVLKATDGPGAVAWSLNGAPEVVQPVGVVFDFPVPGLLSGANKLVLIPVDANQKRGKPVTLAFSAVLGPPSARLEALVYSDGEVPFVPGLSVSPEKKGRIKGTLTWPNPMKSATWALGDGKVLPLPVSGSGGTVPFILALPDDPPFGMVPLTITATDTADQVTTMRTWLDIVNLAKPQGPDGAAFADPRVGTSPLVITPETPLRGVFPAGKIRSVELISSKGSVPASVLQIAKEEQSFTIKAVKDGQFEGVKLRVVSEQGRIYDSDLGTVMGDLAAPIITLSSPLSGGWVRENLRIEGQVSDTNGLSKLEWSIDNGSSWQPLDPPSGQGGSFTRNFTLPGPDQAVNLLIRATDAAGRTGTFLSVVRRDTQAPEIDLIQPVFSAGSRGKVFAVGRLRDEGAVQKAEVTVGGKTVVLPLDRPFTVELDAGAPAAMGFRVTDWAGNLKEQSFSPSEPAADPSASGTASRPEIQILFPKPDTKGLSGTIPVVGRVVGFAAAPQLAVKGEASGDRSLEVTEAGYFTLEVNLTGLKNRGLAFTAAGENKAAASLSLNLPLDPAAGLPQARFLTRGEKPVLTGNVTASGWIGDSRGAVSWIYQLDAGEKKTVTPPAGQPPAGSFLIDLGTPPPGPHKLTVIPVNSLGQEGPPATTEFVSTLPSGTVEFVGLELGAIVAVTKDSKIQGRLTSANPWKKTEIRFADLAQPDPWSGPFSPLEVKRGSDGVWTFDVAIPNTLAYSRIGVAVRGEDSLGQKVEGRTLFHRVWPKDPATLVDKEGLVFIDSRLAEDTGRFVTSPGTPLIGAFRGRPLKSLVLNPPQPALTATNEGGRVSIDAREEGQYGPFTVVATTIDNEVFTSRPLTISADLSGPTISSESPVQASWIRDTVTVKGQVADPSGVASLEVSVDGGTSWQPLPLRAGAYDAKLPVPGPDGLVRVVLRATDRGGQTSLEFRAVAKDGGAPTWALVAPPPERKVNGLTTIIGQATDFNPVASVEYSTDGKVFQPADGTGTFAFSLDFASFAKLPDQFFLRTTDEAGNQAVTPLIIPVDQESDKPVVQIQTPAEGEVIRSDFTIEGLSFDDDGVQALSWRMDQGPWMRLEGVSSFQIPVTLSSLTDNEHVVEVQAEDRYGTKGNVFRSGFKVSLAAPTAVLFSPEIDKTASGRVILVGASMDRNGIQGMEISLDNGLTWNQAEARKKEEALAASTLAETKTFTPAQRQEWEWRFDSTTLKDGTYLVMVRSRDQYGTEGLFTSLVNLDNTDPALTLTSPSDGLPILDVLELEGRSMDNIRLVSLKAELRPIEGPVAAARAVPSSPVVLQTDLPVTPTFNVPWTIGSLPPGWYNLRLEARDAAGNTTYVARNIRIETASADKVEILYPQAGERLTGSFVLEGRVTSKILVEQVLLNFDGKTKLVVEVDDQGFFHSVLTGEHLEPGEHSLVVTAQVSPAVNLASEPKRVIFDPHGPWIRVTSHRSGSFVTQRPFLSGEAGWIAPPRKPEATPDEIRQEQQDAEQHRVVLVEASLDNGKTFLSVQGNETWRFRLESLGLPDGPQPLIFRAKYRDGSVALQRILVTVSQTPPTVALLTPIENGRFNGSLDLAGFTEGASEIKAVEIALRPGDKSGYEVPSFIQGMYLDAHFLGATWWDAGFGLTFFQEAVKLQVQVGQTPESRFWGTVAGAKLIANILQLPAGYFFGPDWSWLSSSFGVGANFSQFSMNETFFDFTSTPAVFLGGIVLQWEVARVLLKDLVFLKSYSWYTEATVWFISSDVQAEARWVFSTGFRLGLF